MQNCSNAHQCALVEKGGKCCESLAQGNGCVVKYLFGGAVIAGLIAILVLQNKTYKMLKKHMRSK